MKNGNVKIASIDIGSNSFLLLLCEANSQGIVKTQKDIIEIVRLGQGLSKNKKFLPEALVRAEKTLREFKEHIDFYKPDLILARATAAARISENSNDLLGIGKKLGLAIEIIPGHKEAELTYQGVFWGQAVSESEYNLLIDIGGASTELIVGRGPKIEYCTSIPFGAVLLTEKYIQSHPVNDQEEGLLKKAIQVEIEAALKSIARFPVKKVIAVAGTPTTIVQSILGTFDEQKINGYALSISSLLDWESKLKTRSIQERITDLGIPKGRADILYAGSVLLRVIVQSLKNDQVIVSTRGVRHGIVADYFMSPT